MNYVVKYRNKSGKDPDGHIGVHYDINEAHTLANRGNTLQTSDFMYWVEEFEPRKAMNSCVVCRIEFSSFVPVCCDDGSSGGCSINGYCSKCCDQSRHSVIK